MVANKENRWKLKLLTYLFLFFFCWLTAVSPVLAFSIKDERVVGEKLLYSVRTSFDLLDDLDITQYINRLGQTVLEVAGIKYFDYHFFVIDNKEFNAFAAPSGLVFFYSGLIGSMNSENELCSVIAHEVGHVVKRHLASRVEKGKYSTTVSLGLALAAVAFGGAVTPALVMGALATGQAANLHFSRQHEEEADFLAYNWLKKLNRDPVAQARALETMRRIARYRSDKLPQYLLTHPNPEARLEYIETLLDIDGKGTKEVFSATDDFDFFRFKYRILAGAMDTQAFKGFLAGVMADNRSSKFQKTMAYYGLSQVKKNEKDYDMSLELLDKVAKVFPEKNILKVDRGTIEYAAGRDNAAERHLREALRIDNSDLYAIFTLAKLLYSTGRRTEAKAYFQSLSYELPEYSKVYFELGKIASDNKRPGLANYYLGQYNLYEGKLRLARENFVTALRYESLSDKTKSRIEELLKKIVRLRSRS